MCVYIDYAEAACWCISFRADSVATVHASSINLTITVVLFLVIDIYINQRLIIDQPYTLRDVCSIYIQWPLSV